MRGRGIGLQYLFEDRSITKALVLVYESHTSRSLGQIFGNLGQGFLLGCVLLARDTRAILLHGSAMIKFALCSTSWPLRSQQVWLEEAGRSLLAVAVDVLWWSVGWVGMACHWARVHRSITDLTQTMLHEHCINPVPLVCLLLAVLVSAVTAGPMITTSSIESGNPIEYSLILSVGT